MKPRAAAGLNFLTPQIFSVARARIAQGGGVEPFRCLHNMLSSQPMCFNLFGPLVGDLSLATQVHACAASRRSRRGDRSPHRVRAPPPLMSTSAIARRSMRSSRTPRPDGEPAFLGIETKLTEPFSPAEYQKHTYRLLTECDGSLWRREAWATMSSSEWNQLWRNHLLVEAMCRHPRATQGRRGRSVLVRHPGDPSVAGVVASYRSFLEAPGETFCDWPLDVVVEAFAARLRDRRRAHLDRRVPPPVSRPRGERAPLTGL